MSLIQIIFQLSSHVGFRATQEISSRYTQFEKINDDFSGQYNASGFNNVKVNLYIMLL